MDLFRSIAELNGLLQKENDCDGASSLDGMCAKERL
jgi:hypothetical protein